MSFDVHVGLRFLVGSYLSFALYLWSGFLVVGNLVLVVSRLACLGGFEEFVDYVEWVPSADPSSVQISINHLDDDIKF